MNIWPGATFEIFQIILSHRKEEFSLMLPQLLITAEKSLDAIDSMRFTPVAENAL